jgi:hypothetical protein
LEPVSFSEHRSLTGVETLCRILAASTLGGSI